MKKILFFLPLILVSFTLFATDYYIAADGNDSNNGTSTSAPWKSLNKLNAYFSKLKPGDRVFLRRGDTFYGSINITRSGTAGAPITIGAYGSGEKPVVSGFTTVSSWRNIGGNIWESTDAVSNLPYTNLVVVDGVNTPMGRYPNEGYLYFQSHNGTSSITSNALGGSPNWTGADVVIKKERWTLHRSKITSHSGNTLYYNTVDGRQPYDAWGFFIQNDPKTLDSPGEWYYDRVSKKLRIFSFGNPTGVKIATVENLISINRNSYISFDNLTFTGANNYGFDLFLTNSIVVRNSDFIFIGVKAVRGDMAANTVVEGCKIKDVNNCAIYLMSNGSYGAIIKSNEIENIGILPGMRGNTSYHAFQTYGANTLVQYNNIRNTGYGGIFFRGSNVAIKNNFIQNFCSVLDDAAGIYTNGFGKDVNNLVDGNIVLNPNGGAGEGTSKPKSSQGHGIMMDDNAAFVTISNNTIANGPNSGLKIHNAHDLKVIDNVFYNNGDGVNDSKGAIELMNNDRNLDLIRNIQIKNNVFFAKEAYQWGLLFATIFDFDDVKSFGEADGNYYMRPIKKDGPFNHVLTGNNRWPGYLHTLVNWQNFLGQEKGSQSGEKAITDVKELRFEYNASAQSKTITLDANYIDCKNNSYDGTITLAPYTSAVLIRNGAIKGGTVKANAGEDQTITLPSNSVVLNGSAEVQGRKVSSYLWSKLSGPSAGSIVNDSEASSSVKDLVEGVYVFQLKVTDNSGESSVAEMRVTVKASGSLLAAVNPGSIVNGLDYKYYEEQNFSVVPDFSKLSEVKTGTVESFDLSIADRNTQFGVEYKGYIDIPSDGQYTFYTTSDDGSMLYIDDQLVVNNDGLHGAIEKSGTIGLKAGKHAISVSFFQQYGDKVLAVNYMGPGISKRIVPVSSLFRKVDNNLLPAINVSDVVKGVEYSYYEQSDLFVVPDFSKIKPVKSGTVDNFDLSVANRQERFAVEFRAYIDVPADGQYTFYTTSDDGSLLYIDDNLVVNNDGLHAATERSGTIGLKAGKHSISVGFFQQFGSQLLNVSFEGPGISKQSISASSLFRSSNLLPSVNVTNTVNGLDFNYYEGGGFTNVPDFTKLTPIKTGTSGQFDLSVANRSERYAIQFNGYIDVPVDGEYTFYTTSDDGSMLYIDGSLVVNNDGLHGALTRAGTVGLQAGKHAISVGFFQQDWDKVLDVQYEGPGINRQTIPMSALYRSSITTNGLNYNYYEGSNYFRMPEFSKITPVKTGRVSNFDLSVANRRDVFAIEFSGYINITQEGQYTFYTTSDDGSLLFINNSLVVNNDGLHSAIERSGSVYLTPGQYPIYVSFFQQNWDKSLEVKYEGPGISKQTIPSSVLFSETLDPLTKAMGSFSRPIASTAPLKNEHSDLMDEQVVQAFPNPFVNSFKVSLNGDAGEFELQLMDALGRTLFTRSGKKNAGLYQQTINASSLQKGIYFLRVTQNNKSYQIKLLK